MKKALPILLVACLSLGLAGCSAEHVPAAQKGHPQRMVLHPYRVAVTNDNLLTQPRTQVYEAEVIGSLAERYFTAPSNGIAGNDLAVYYTPVKVKLTGPGALSGTEQYLGLISDSGLDYPLDKLVAGTKLVVFLVADPAPRSDGLSEAAPSWVGLLDDSGQLVSLSPHDSVNISFESIRSTLGL